MLLFLMLLTMVFMPDILDTHMLVSTDMVLDMVFMDLESKEEDLNQIKPNM